MRVMRVTERWRGLFTLLLTWLDITLLAQESSTDSVDHISPSRIDPFHLASHVDNCPRPQTVARESIASRTSSPSQSFETTYDVQPDFFFIVIIIIIDRSDQTRPTDRSDDDKQAIETTGYTHRQAASAGTTNGFPAGDGTGGCRSVDGLDGWGYGCWGTSISSAFPPP